MATSLPTSSKRPKSEVETDEEDNNEQDDCCGICYVERGISIPGEIDSCNHYFCFVCIMEWAKHESRCPICRQRFSNIRRLPKLGVFSSSRDVKVPLRDQVYHPHGNMTSGPVDSNAELKCCICHVAKDENLIIICDLCDMASHTYCVGLAYTVPEGDWFCHDCAVSRETNDNDGLDLDQQTVELTAEPGVTILDIVRETSSQVAGRPMASSIRQNNSLSSAIPLVDRVNRSEGKKPLTAVQRAQCNVQLLRENWNSLRSGSLKFERKSFQSGGTSSQKHDSSSSSRGKLDGSHSMASTGRQQPTVQGAQSSNMVNDVDLKYDVHKAWQMMDKANTMKQTPRRTSRITQVVDDDPSCSGTREKLFAPRSCPELENQQPKTLDFRCTRMEEQCGYSSLKRNFENHLSPLSGEKRKSRVSCEEKIQHLRDHTSTHSVGYSERPLPSKVHTSNHSAPCHDERNDVKQQRQSTYLVTSVGSPPSRGKSDGVFASNKDVVIINKESKFAKGFGNGITKNTEDAKTEIQSLVKLNLKCLTRAKQLGVETFKVVARQATHTILAACHSEQQKSSIYSSSSVCSHTDHILQFQKSTLMPNCCRPCFHVFVNDVVKSIMLEKLSNTPLTLLSPRCGDLGYETKVELCPRIDGPGFHTLESSYGTPSQGHNKQFTIQRTSSAPERKDIHCLDVVA